MQIKENIRIGISGLLSHKLRSLLTVLGVIFGVAAVISMVSIGEGAKREATKQIDLLGVNTIRLRYIPLSGPDLREAIRKNIKGLTRNDAESITLLVPEIQTVGMQKDTYANIYHQGKIPSYDVSGVSPDYFNVIGHKIDYGRFFTAIDERNANKVCILGNKVSTDLFGFARPLNKQLKIGNTWFKVVGALKSKGSVSQAIIDVKNPDLCVFIPLSTALKRFATLETDSELTEIVLRLSSSEKLSSIGKLIETIIRRRHKEIEDFEVIIPQELLKQRQKTQRLFNLIMALIAGISLLVGGIGIMNIMLANISQRTKEIGIRRSIGASASAILWQFLIECVLLSLVGGIIGILIGMTLAKIISIWTGWQTVIAIRAVLVSFFVSMTIGIIFGLYPAQKAAKLDPVEALRYE